MTHLHVSLSCGKAFKTSVDRTQQFHTLFVRWGRHGRQRRVSVEPVCILHTTQVTPQFTSSQANTLNSYEYGKISHSQQQVEAEQKPRHSIHSKHRWTYFRYHKVHKFTKRMTHLRFLNTGALYTHSVQSISGHTLYVLVWRKRPYFSELWKKTTMRFPKRLGQTLIPLVILTAACVSGELS